MSQRARFALAAVLLLALGLRLTGLSWGLRHKPHWDERVFVESAGWMVAKGDFDHRFYEYPGLFIYLIAPVLAFFHPPALGPSAYLAARAVIALFGVGSVALVFVLGRRLGGERLGLVAALLLAVSPVEVVTAHTVRPDVALESFVLLALLAFGRLGVPPGPDLLAGTAVGAATAIKFTGVLLAPSYALARLLAPGPFRSRLAVAALVAAAVVLLCTPYALLKPSEYLAGVHTQWAAHYSQTPERSPYLDNAAYYLGSWGRSLGAAGGVLSIFGMWAVRRDWRRWAPLVVYPPVALLVLSTATLRFDRHMVPTLGVATLTAAAGIAALAGPRARGATLLALAAALPPAASSVRYVAAMSRPGTRDQALDWIDAHARPGARILTSVRELGLDPARYELIAVDRLDEGRRLQALSADFVVADPETDGRALRDLRPAFVAEPGNPYAGPRIAVLTPGPARPAYRRLAIEPGWLSASQGSAGLAALVDNDLETVWATAPGSAAGSWLQVSFHEPTPVARIDLVLGRRERRFGRNVHVYLSEDLRTWQRALATEGRPPVARQVDTGEGRSQVLLIEGRSVRGLRLVEQAEQARPWGMAELVLYARGEGEP